LTIRAFAKRRAQFKELLSSNNNLNADRYFRLMALAGVDLLCTVPLATWSLYNNMTAYNVHPWLSWEDTHSNFSRVVQYPRVLYSLDPLAIVGLEVTRWSVVACGMIFFAFFGFADEARRHYRLAFNSVAKRMGYSTATVSSSGNMSSNGYVFPCIVLPKACSDGVDADQNHR
jgi:pheromone a factor receptor